MKKLLILLMAAIFVFAFAACSNEDSATEQETSEEVETSQETTQEAEVAEAGSEFVYAEIEGAIVDYDFFTMTMLDGWQSMDLGTGVQVYKGNEALQIGLEGFGLDEAYVESYISGSVETYSGTEMTTVEIWNHEFYTTSYEFSGTYQTLYATLFTDGQQLVIKANTESEGVSDDMMAMINSVVLK